MVTFSSPTPPQDLSEDIENQLLEALLCAHSAPAASTSSSSTTSDIPHPTSDIPQDISPLSLSRRFNISLTLVLDFLARSDTRTRLAAALECSDILHHQHNQRARTRALSALESILDKSEDPVEIRRAATAILRPSRAISPSSIRAHRDPAEAPQRTLRPPASKPSRNRDAQQTIWHILNRLGDNHNPSDNAGLTTLHNHLHAKAGFPADLDTFLKSPGNAAKLTGASSFMLHAPEPDLDENSHEQWATLTWPDLTLQHIRFTLCRQTHGNKLWLISETAFDWELKDEEDDAKPVKTAQPAANTQNPTDDPASEDPADELEETDSSPTQPRAPLAPLSAAPP